MDSSNITWSKILRKSYFVNLPGTIHRNQDYYVIGFLLFLPSPFVWELRSCYTAQTGFKGFLCLVSWEANLLELQGCVNIPKEAFFLLLMLWKIPQGPQCLASDVRKVRIIYFSTGYAPAFVWNFKSQWHWESIVTSAWAINPHPSCTSHSQESRMSWSLPCTTLPSPWRMTRRC